ncbi:MAG: XdhC family protein, partial [Myxococcaceae bacterium]|nr:XdhC family protein [Myxococcaceae bacterium]
MAEGRAALAKGLQAVLATVIAVRGSAYRRPGARMLVTSEGWRAGSLSGGCLE